MRSWTDGQEASVKARTCNMLGGYQEFDLNLDFCLVTC